MKGELNVEFGWTRQADEYPMRITIKISPETSTERRRFDDAQYSIASGVQDVVEEFLAQFALPKHRNPP